MKSSLFLTSASAFVLAVASGGLASAQAPTTPSVIPSKTGQLEEVVVTASRRAENLQRLAIPVTAVSASQLEARGVVNPQDLSKAVTGVSVSPNGNVSQVFIRGIGTYTIQNYSDSAVAFNVDNAYLGLPALINGTLFDLQRVEVLKGPQGTLYGRNASAGAINAITNKPIIGDLSGNLSFELGDYALKRLTFGVNIPVNDKVAARIASQIVNRNGYFTDGGSEDKEESLRLQVLLKPTDKLAINLAYNLQYQDGRGTEFVAHPFQDPSNPYLGSSTTLGNQQLTLAQTLGDNRGIAGVPLQIPSVVSRTIPLVTTESSLKNQAQGGRAELNYDFGAAILTVIGSYQHLHNFTNTQPGFRATYTAVGEQTSLEGRLASPNAGGRLKWVVGAYGYGFNVDQTAPIGLGVTTLGLIESGFGTRTRDRSYAGFGEATFSVTNSLRLTGGLRYTRETSHLRSGAFPYTQSFTGAITPTPIYSPAAPANSISFVSHVPASTPNAAAQFFPVLPAPGAEFKNTSFKVGLEHDLTSRSMIYATLSTGFKAGSVLLDAPPNLTVILPTGATKVTGVQSNQIRPEKLTAYTIGAKNRFFEQRLQFNVEAFYWDYKDHQEQVFLPNNYTGSYAPRLTNVPRARLAGVNVESELLLGKNDLLTAQVEYLDGKFTEFAFRNLSVNSNVGVQTTCAVTNPAGPITPTSVSTIDCKGKPFVRAPKWSAVLGYQHTFDLSGGSRLVAGVNSQISTSYYVAAEFLQAELQKSAAITDVNLGYVSPTGKWSLTGFVRNVSNTAVMNGGFLHPVIPGLFYAQLRPPRTYSVLLKAAF